MMKMIAFNEKKQVLGLFFNNFDKNSKFEKYEFSLNWFPVREIT